MRFASLGSGSRGNATLIEVDATCVMMDCGFPLAETERRLARLGKRPEQLSALLVTHEHGDHSQGIVALARKYALTVWMTAGTQALVRTPDGVRVQCFSPHESFTVQDLYVEPFPVPHDAREPCQFLFGDGARRLGIMTDTGCITPHIVRCLNGLDALLLECNHDSALLQAGHYPPRLKRRIAGNFGHLSNAEAGGLLPRVDTGRLQHLVAAHLSEHNNTPAHARQALSSALGCAEDWIAVADQEAGLAWRQVT